LIYFYFAALVIAGVLYYSIVIEPNRIEITRHEICIPSLSAELDGIRICQVADMHLNDPARNTRAILDALRSVKADLFLLTGDQIRGRKGMNAFLRLLPEIEPTIRPAFAVQGNAEHRKDVLTKHLAARMTEDGIRTLVNTSATIQVRGTSVQLVGVDDPHYFADNFQMAYSCANPALFTILLCHSPDGLRNLNGFRADLALCGHTHAGQIRFPLIGALWGNTRRVKLLHGWYTGADLERRAGAPIGRTRVYVSRGLGTGRFAGRFLCRPELPVITLRRT
jgi:predicted MPP superfamily phosphohydrolase